jgi:hypothetical protein
MAEQFADEDPVEAVCADLAHDIHDAIGPAALRRAFRWLSANRDGADEVANDLELAREVIAFLRVFAEDEWTYCGSQMSDRAIVLLEQRLCGLPTQLRAIERLISPLSKQNVLEKVLIEPWENGLKWRRNQA